MSPGAKAAIPAAKLALYEKLIATNPEIERKGAAFLKKYKTKLFETYGVVKKDWAVVPDSLLAKTAELRPFLERSFAYVKTLKPKDSSARPARRAAPRAGGAGATSPPRTNARRRR